MTLRKCSCCKKLLPESYFASNSSLCKTCRREYDWQYRYGISPEQYLYLFKVQEGKCKICGYEPKDGEFLHIDHDKRTGEVRGLLCGKCNRGLGMFDEDTKHLVKAIKYIKENK